MSYKNLSTDDVKARLDRGDPFRLIDVREPEEYAVARIEGAELLPLSRAQEWIPTLLPDEDLVVMCHHGSRSLQVVRHLAMRMGFTNVANMVGGIEEWAIRIDSNVPRY